MYFKNLKSRHFPYFPTGWKRAKLNVIYIYKADPSNQEITISLVICVAKSRDNCSLFKKYLFSFIIKNNSLTPFHSGFVLGNPTVNLLVDLCKTR